jgi:phosphoribosylaminoimidazolecarboxamide formyltransferase / IMP cyclohydrolase
MAHILSSVSGADLDRIPIRRALLSVSDKSGLLDLARTLASFNVELLSTGGTAKAMRDAGLTVIDVSDYTGSPEILDGRVKTLHPKVHGGLLGVRGNPKHEQEMTENNIGKIDLVVMNLYPFTQTVASGADFNMCIENIDIGGPSMLRSSAKNHKYVSILCQPNQYDGFLAELNAQQGSISHQTRKRLAAQAFATSATYDAAIAEYFSGQLANDTPAETSTITTVTTRAYTPVFHLKYGCNPHQKPSAILAPLGQRLPFQVINGVPGYINLLDALNAWQLVRELRFAFNDTLPAAASFKHVSPAGAAIGIPLTPIEAQAYEFNDVTALSPTALAYVRARNADPLCSFGDFVAISHIVDLSTAQVIKTEVCDGIIAPGFEPEALEILRAKKKGGFIILAADLHAEPATQEYREVFGTVFAQRRNDVLFSAKTHLHNVVVGDATNFTEDAQRDLVVASIAIKYTQSNSVGYALHGQMIGVGAGQQSRVDCVKLAARKVRTWYLRQHPKVQQLPFKSTVKRQERVNARVRYIEGDFTASELPVFLENFTSDPVPLTEDEKNQFINTLTGVSISSDAFFPFRDSIDHASKVGVQYIAQPGGSIADEEVKAAAREYNMLMAFTDLRLFHH